MCSSDLVQDLIDAKEIEFEAPERPNVVTAPMPKHEVNAVEEDLFVVSVDDIVTPLLTVKKNLLLSVYSRAVAKVAICVLFYLLVAHP